MMFSSSQSGFTLVEVLVAITILLLVVTGPMTILTSANRSNAFSTEQVQAFFFAQEGLELAQKARDDRSLAYFDQMFAGDPVTVSPFADLQADFSACFSSAGCGLVISDSDVVAVVSCSDSMDCRLYENTDPNGRSRFVHNDAGTPTPYTRIVRMEEEVGASGNISDIKVTSRVTWRTGSLIATQQVESVGYLFNVYDTP